MEKNMHKISVITLIHILLNGCFFFGENKRVIDIDKKRPNDLRTFRTLTLENKLQVLLISDPSLNKSAAAMDVHVGSLSDPIEHQGLAHFLEHMLFLGTEKYPDIDEYNQFLNTYQGYSNAYTSDENTNYFFEVNHQGFEGAIDRFAQFFIAPKFNAEFVERELNAVHSEHQKNLQNDFWRKRMVHYTLMKDNHPRRKFSTGDKTTLQSVDRNTLIEFYRQHYSANIMKLVFLSPKTLDEQEKLARSSFSAIANYDHKLETFDSEQYESDALPRMISVKPVKDLKKLELIFPTPSKDQYWQSKPYSILAHLIGHEGKGSLLSLLKKENLAIALSTWVDSSSYTGSLHVDITLTDQGIDKKDEVIEYFFSFVQLMKKNGLKDYIYSELKTMADIDYIYREHKEGGNVASSFASLMHAHNPLLIEKNEYLFHRYSAEDYTLFLDKIAPEYLNVFFVNKKAQTSLTEKYYGSEYGVSPIKETTLKKWQQPRQDKRLSLPEPNPFIPQKLELMSANAPASAEKIIDNKWGIYWFQQDDSFHLPKAHGRLVILTPEVNKTPYHKVMSQLYVEAIDEGLNEWSYEISLAGLDYGLSRSDKGIQIDFGGYAENLSQLIVTLSEKLKEIKIDEDTFENIKNELKRGVRNQSFDVAYRQLIYQMKYLTQKNKFHYRDYFDPEGVKNVDLISKVTIKDLQGYMDTLYKEIAIEGATFGSINHSDVKESILAFTKNLHSKPLPESLRPQNKTIAFKKGEPAAYVFSANNNNNSWGKSIQFGRRDAELNARIRIGQAILETSFFTEMRTKQQLGYLVYSGLNYDEKVLGLLYLVQSSQYSPFEISKRARTWMDQSLNEVKKITPEKFGEIKKSVIQDLKEKDKTMIAKMDTLYFESVIMEGEFNYKDKIATAAEKITSQDVYSTFAKAFDRDAPSLTLYLTTAAEKPILSQNEVLILNETEYKNHADTFE